MKPSQSQTSSSLLLDHVLVLFSLRVWSLLSISLWLTSVIPRTDLQLRVRDLEKLGRPMFYILCFTGCRLSSQSLLTGSSSIANLVHTLHNRDLINIQVNTKIQIVYIHAWISDLPLNDTTLVKLISTDLTTVKKKMENLFYLKLFRVKVKWENGTLLHKS